MMSVGRVVRHFQGVGRVPVSIGEVLDVIREIAPDEIIDIWGVDIDPRILRGNCYRYRRSPLPGSFATETRHALITYSSRMPLGEQRLVCCKELVHILDPDPILTTTAIQVVSLADNLVNQSTAPIKNQDDVSAFLDRMARLQALAILFPYGLWEDIMPKYKSGKVSVV